MTKNEILKQGYEMELIKQLKILQDDSSFDNYTELKEKFMNIINAIDKIIEIEKERGEKSGE